MRGSKRNYVNRGSDRKRSKQLPTLQAATLISDTSNPKLLLLFLAKIITISGIKRMIVWSLSRQYTE